VTGLMMVFNRNRSQVFTSKCGPSAMSSSPRSSSISDRFCNRGILYQFLETKQWEDGQCLSESYHVIFPINHISQLFVPRFSCHTPTLHFLAKITTPYYSTHTSSFRNFLAISRPHTINNIVGIIQEKVDFF